MKKTDFNLLLESVQEADLIHKGLEKPSRSFDFSEEQNGGLKIYINVKSHKTGVGTRGAGELFRGELIDLYNRNPQSITLDFEGISIIGSGFADELIGKLITKIGLFEFFNVFHFENMNLYTKLVLQRSVVQRMYVEWYANPETKKETPS